VQPISTPGRPPGQAEPSYTAELLCPLCRQTGTQRLLRSRQVLTLQVKKRPFQRAFCWSEGYSRLLDSPLFYGVCVCPHCRYPAAESDFRLEPSATHPNQKALCHLFLEEKAGTVGPLAEILGPPAEGLADPERAIRWTLAAIRTETLLYPERWRRRELGRHYLRLFWLFLDEGHFAWDQCKPLEAMTYLDIGPNHPRLTRILAGLEGYRSLWPEIPLAEEVARDEALRFHREVYEQRPQEPEPEEAVAEERQLAQLFGLTGQTEQSRDMLDRARATCMRLRQEAAQQQQAAWDEVALTLAERRLLTTRIQRLGLLASEIAEERTDLFGPIPRTQGKPAPAAPVRSGGKPPAAKAVKPKRRFSLFG
jgi:hypothetical protein